MGNFITNSEKNLTLGRRIKDLISISNELKFLVGFFYFSGWRELYSSLKENPDVVLKILVGLNVDRFMFKTIEHGVNLSEQSGLENFNLYKKSLKIAVNNEELDRRDFYEQVDFFLKLLEEGRLIICKTLKPNHAKLYLFKLKEHYRTTLNIEGIIVTGSSNLTKAGFSNNEEFNVEIKDYGFKEAEDYFDDLWERADKITEIEEQKRIIIDILINKSIAANISPFEAYAFSLKTYLDLQEKKALKDSLIKLLEKRGFQKFSYQLDAVNQAVNILETYNGVIIADVVGLGKSVIASMVAKQLGKRGLILCPPGLIGNENEGTGWWEYLLKFELYNWDIESVGKLEDLANSLAKDDRGYEVIIIDEAHRFRNQDTAAYQDLATICKGKKVILLTATPFNNSPADIFSLLKLFLIPGQSGLTIDPDLEARFASYNSKFNNYSFILKNYNSPNPKKRQRAEVLYKKYFKALPVEPKIVKDEVSKMAKEIKNVIEPVVIRRNRIDLQEDFEYRKEIDKLSKVNDPEKLFFELTPEQSRFYDWIIRDCFGEYGKFTGAIYRPYEYEKKINDDDDSFTLLQQKNLHDFMRRLLIKRFESSFGAFEQSVKRFLRVHKVVKKFVLSSGKYILDRKVIESIYDDENGFDPLVIEKTLIDFAEKTKKGVSPKHSKIYDVNKFKRKKEFIENIDKDIKLFEEIEEQIGKLNLVEKDPKREKVLEKVIDILGQQKNPKRKVIIFTEYTDTVNHLKPFFEQALKRRVLFCDGTISKKLALELEENFNARHPEQKDDYDVLITTDKLSEGFNLNRAGAIINYDIPWNPTRVIQRVGRINRIGTKVFDELFIYNFFPTEQGEKHVNIEEIASQKMFLIHNALGEDSKIFSPDEEPSPSGLFKKLNVNPDALEEATLLTKIRNEYKQIEERFPEVIEKINQLPFRVKTAKKFPDNNVVVLRKKGLALFSLFATGEKKKDIRELTFEDFLLFSRCDYMEEKLPVSERFWNIYEKLKNYSEKIHVPKSTISIETKALSSLNTLIRLRERLINEGVIDKNLFTEELAEFITILKKDLRKYKTLAKYTLRNLIIEETELKDKEKLTDVLTFIKDLKNKWGMNYLERIDKQLENIREEVIIAIENRKD